MDSRHINPHKVSIWILRGGNAGVTLNFCIKRLLRYAGLVVALLIAVAVGLNQLGPTDEELSAQSLAVLEAYLNKQLRETQFASPEKTQVTANETLPEIDETLERKVQLLAEEFIRIRTYENRLRERIQTLESVLDTAIDLEGAPLPINELTDGNKPDEELGMGGGDFSTSPLFSSYPSLQDTKASKASALLSTLERLDVYIDTLSNLPLGSPVMGRVSSRFGTRRSPFTGRRQPHHGFDISVRRKTVVRATADGVVLKAGRKGAYGRTVIIDHGGKIETLYGHLSSISVKAGDRVCRGQAIGKVGSTGRSTGPHVHYEVRVAGRPRDPEPFIYLSSLLNGLG